MKCGQLQRLVNFFLMVGFWGCFRVLRGILYIRQNLNSNKNIFSLIIIRK